MIMLMVKSMDCTNLLPQKIHNVDKGRRARLVFKISRTEQLIIYMSVLITGVMESWRNWEIEKMRTKDTFHIKYNKIVRRQLIHISKSIPQIHSHSIPAIV